MSLHHRRHPHFDGRFEPCAGEAGWCDPDNREAYAVQRHLAAQRVRGAVEAPPPEPVADHGHGMRADGAIVVARQKTSELRRQAQHVEELAGNQLHTGGFRLAGRGQHAGVGDAAHGRHTVGRGKPVAQLFEEWVRSNRAAIGSATGSAPHAAARAVAPATSAATLRSPPRTRRYWRRCRRPATARPPA